MRGRQAVSVVFDEGNRSYVVRRITGDSIVLRGFSNGEDIVLSGIDLQMPGDSLVFDSRGIVDLSEISDPLGRAVFQSGTRSYDVWFNSMGATRLDSS